MLYLTGDTHNEPGRFALIEQMVSPQPCDTVMVCGDFGYLNSKAGEQVLDQLEQRSYTVCFCDGNHENFDRLAELPITSWCGGKVHQVRKNVFHLMRGEIYDIDGKRIFVMGGAYSGDAFSKEDSRELPDNAAYDNASKNLERYGYDVDCIVTHTAPREILLRMGKHPYAMEAELNGFLDWIMYEVKYKRWYFGHLHQDVCLEPKFRALHFDVCKIGG